MGAEGGDWSVDCSDDESYGLAYSELCQQFVPESPAVVIRLVESLAQSAPAEAPCLTLDWTCPGRRRDATLERSDGEADVEEPKAEEKSDFDFWDEPASAASSASVGSASAVKAKAAAKAPRGSAKKKTTSLDGILSSMRRHRKIDNAEERKVPVQSRPKAKLPTASDS